MKNKVLLGLLVALALVCTACKGADDPDIPTPPKNTDSVIVRGVNISNWFIANSAASIGKTVYKEVDFKNMKSLGIGRVRLAIQMSSMVGGSPSYTFQPEFFDKLDYAMDIAEKDSMELILDNHSWLGGGYNQSTFEAEMVKIWQQIAVHCKERSKLIIYELLNEPSGDFIKNNWGRIQGNIIDSIRMIDTIHTVIVGGSDANSYKTLQDLPVYGDKNLLYTFHLYDPLLFTHQGADWTSPTFQYIDTIPFPWSGNRMPACPAIYNTLTGYENVPNLYSNYKTDGTIGNVKNCIDMVVTFAKSRNVKLFLGEFGVLYNTVGNDDRCNWHRTVREYAESKGISWTLWDWNTYFGVFRKNTQKTFPRDLNKPLIEALGLKNVQ